MRRIVIICVCVLLMKGAALLEIIPKDEEREWYRMDCSDSHEDSAESYQYPVRFFTVVLVGCAPPPAGSYAEMLRTRNVIISRNLELIDIPTNANISATSFAGLPSLEHFHLSATDGELVLSSSALSSLSGIRSLSLNHVRADQVPPHLDVLELYQTGVTELPANALDVIELQVIEERLSSISGSAQRLRWLQASGTVGALPQAPALNTLILGDDLTTNLREGLVAQYGALETIKLFKLRGSTLSTGLLLNAAQLRHFQAMNNSFTSLPSDLFSYSRKLRVIDLASNRLETLPGGLFLGLLELESLTLAHNLLKAQDLDSVIPLTSLKFLDLSDNQLGDLCPTGTTSPLSPLHELRLLHMSNTSLIRVCTDWLHDNMPHLLTLDLRTNSVHNLTCTLMTQDPSYHYTIVNLMENPIERYTCTKADYERALRVPVSTKYSIEYYDVNGLKCDCNSYWVSRIMRERYQNFKTQLQHDIMPCTQEWLHCETPDSDTHFPAYEVQPSYEVSCLGITITDPTQPRLLTPTHFRTVSVKGCAPPSNTSYVKALRMLNVEVENNLELFNISFNAELTATSLADLPASLVNLSLSAIGGVLVPKEGILAELNGLRTLSIASVSPNILPSHLNVLRLQNTGHKVLPSQALDVLELKVEEERLEGIYGLAPRLQWLHVTGPAVALPQAPLLKEAFLSGAPAERLHPGLVEECGTLERLELYQLSGLQLQPGLLRGATQLRFFVLSQTNLTMLPLNLFNSSTKLELIYLTDNKLESLQRDLFSKLKNLKILFLDNNHLSSRGLDAVNSLKSLQYLALNGNPIGDLCPPGVNSKLSELKKLLWLEIPNTRLTRICMDWVNGDMPELFYLNVDANSVRSIPCAVHNVQRNTSLYIFTYENPLEHIDCSREDYESSLQNPDRVEMVLVSTFKNFKCDCGGYWASRILRDYYNVGNNYAVYPAFENDPCTLEWQECDTTTPEVSAEDSNLVVNIIMNISV